MIDQGVSVNEAAKRLGIARETVQLLYKERANGARTNE